MCKAVRTGTFPGVCIIAVMVLACAAGACGYPETYDGAPRAGEQAYTGIEIYLPQSNIVEGGSAQARLFALRADGRTDEIVPVLASWECGDGSVAEVSVSALLTAKSPGTDTLVARYEGLSAARPFTVAPVPDYSGLLLSEIYYDPPVPETAMEFVEIVNRGARSCDIAGFRIVDAGPPEDAFVFPEGCVIAAGEKLTIARTAADFTAYLGSPPSFEGMGFYLSNTGETVFLLDMAGTIMDAVYVKGGADAHPASPEWGSLSLPSCGEGFSAARLPGADTDTHADWACESPSPGS
ncbi:MAG: lamin tail domain-containing protein [Spirochaetes bacterium]|nr:MAG: lamin tail domain-containing protein [Spirochaetota bacterium]